MNQEDILKMAREADCGHESMTLDWIAPDGLERFAALVAAKAAQDERDQCAMLCESEYPTMDGFRPCFDTPEECAEAIRARGQ